MFLVDQGGPWQGPQNTNLDVCLMLDDELGLEVANGDLIELDKDVTSLSDLGDSTLTVDGLQPTPGLSPATSLTPKPAPEDVAARISNESRQIIHDIGELTCLLSANPKKKGGGRREWTPNEVGGRPF
jgi:hypothetical protein